MVTGPAHHEFSLGGVAAGSLFLGNEEVGREEEHLPLLGPGLAARLDAECVLGNGRMENGGM